MDAFTQRYLKPGVTVIQNGRPTSAERYAHERGYALPAAAATAAASKATRQPVQAVAPKPSAPTGDPRAERRKIALQRMARTGGPTAAEAKRMLAEDETAAAQKAKADELAALPKSIEEAGGDARAYAKADMQRRAAAAMRGR